MENITTSSIGDEDVAHFKKISPVVRIAVKDRQRWFAGTFKNLTDKNGKFELRVNPRVAYIHRASNGNIANPAESLLYPGDEPDPKSLVSEDGHGDQIFTLVSPLLVSWPGMPQNTWVIQYQTIDGHEASVILSSRERDKEAVNRLIESVTPDQNDKAA